MSRLNERSPIKDRPLRHAGQSLEEERAALWDDKLEPAALMALFFLLLTGLEWRRYWMAVPPNPILFSIVALIMVGFAAWRIWRYLPPPARDPPRHRRRESRRPCLERLRARGYHVFHDIVGPTFNVEHVLIGPAGVFTIETKTWSKPASGDARVTGDAEGLLVAGQRPERDPVVQARAQAGWLHQQLTDSTGKPFPVRPVIVSPDGSSILPPNVRRTCGCRSRRHCQLSSTTRRHAW